MGVVIYLRKEGKEMKQLNELKWRSFDIHEIFPDVKRGKRLKTNNHISGNMAYVSSSAANNGVDAFIGNKDKVRIFEDCITLANSGSVGTAFYHPYSFVASDHVTRLKNNSYNKYIYLFIATIANRLSEKYSFNREINDKRLEREKILLPIDDNNRPDYAFMEEYMREVEKRLLLKYKTYLSDFYNIENGGGKMKDISWKEFSLNEICNIKSGVRLVARDMKEGNTPFVGATDSGNGLTKFISNTNASIDSNVLGVNYNGNGVAIGFYHPYKALFSDDVKRVKIKDNEGNKYVYLFLKASILKQKDKYQYGYKFSGERMNRQKVMLPSTPTGCPDYQYMERYMRQQEMLLLNKYIDKYLK